MLAGCAILLLISGCSSTAPGPTARAGRLYPAAGPAHDPWQPYINEASDRFDVPEQWIRAVMKVESGGRTHLNGSPITSHAGAMGLMQLMPATYAEMRDRHGLGNNPHDPRDNILAGTAYLREMYNRFGSPGFLAAYNCGPGCYGEILTGDRRMPQEIRNYLAMIAPQIDGIHPVSQSGVTMVAQAAPSQPLPSRREVQIASIAPPERYRQQPESMRVASPPEPRYVMASANPVRSAPLPPISPAGSIPRSGGGTAEISRTPTPGGGAAKAGSARGQWGIQIGAFTSPTDSLRALDSVARSAPRLLASAERHIMEVETPSGRLYRARLTGFTSQTAGAACAEISLTGGACMTISPDA